MDHATHVTGNFTCEGSALTCMPEERERRSKGGVAWRVFRDKYVIFYRIT